MTAEKRIAVIRLLDMMKDNKNFCRETGVYDASTFMGKRVSTEKIPDEAVSLTGNGFVESKGAEK